MDGMKRVFALLFAFAAIMLMQTYVYAYTGSGTKNDPYTVTTYNELKKCCEEGGYVKLGSNIIYSGTSSIGIKKDLVTHLDLNSKTLDITNKGMVFYLTGTAVLYIEDNANGNGYIKHTNTSEENHYGIIESDGNSRFIINGGNLLSTYSISAYMAGTYVINGGNLTSQKGPALNQNNLSSSLIINGGTIRSNNSEYAVSAQIKSGDSTGLIVNGGEIYGLYCYYEYGDMILGDFTVHNKITLEAGKHRTFKWTDDGRNITVNGSDYVNDTEYNNEATTIEGANIVFTNDTKRMTKCSISGDAAPVAGQLPKYPIALGNDPYTVSSKWYYTGGNELRTEFEAGQSYTLKTEVTLKNTTTQIFQKDIFEYLFFDLKDVDSRLYKMRVLSVTDTTVYAEMEFEMLPCFKTQPQDVTDAVVNGTSIFTAAAENAETYQWYLTDSNGDVIDWSDAGSNLSVDITNAPALTVNILGKYANQYKIYCVASGAGYSVTSRTVSISYAYYNVSFDKNGGSGDNIAARTVMGGTAVSLPDCTFTPPLSDDYRYSFDCWKKTGNAADRYAPGDEPVITGDTVFYPAWKSEKIYTVSCRAGDGGSGTMDFTAKLCNGEKFVFPYCTYTPPENKEFDVWLAPFGAKQEYSQGEEVVYDITSDSVIYPRWRYKTLVVKFNTQNKCTPPPSKTVTYNTSLPAFDDPTADGFNFVGWYYDSGYTRKFSFTDKILENITLYAKWEDIDGTGSFNFDTDQTGRIKVYYLDDVTIDTGGWTVADYYIYTLYVNGTAFTKIYTGYSPFVIDDDMTVTKKTDGVVTEYKLKDFLKPENEIYVTAKARLLGTTVTEITSGKIYIDVVYRQGDMDKNGFVNAADAELLLKHISRMRIITDTDTLKLADVNNDYKADMLDVIQILQHAGQA